MSYEAVFTKIERKIREGKWTLDEVREAVDLLSIEHKIPRGPADLPKDDEAAKAKLAAEAKAKASREQARAKLNDLGEGFAAVIFTTAESLTEWVDTLLNDWLG